MSRPSLPCPKCKKLLHDQNEPAKTALAFEDCFRRCDDCRVGFSNARTEPTRIWKNVADNLPAEAQTAACETLARSINTANLGNKRVRFGYNSSEDAVTWVVFYWLGRQKAAVQASIWRKVLGEWAASAPTVLLWGAPVPPSPEGWALRDRLIEECDSIGEKPQSRTEPDVVLSFASGGVAIIEVKLGAPNDVKKDTEKNRAKFDKYVENTGAFRPEGDVRDTLLYELSRNWRFAWALGETHPALVNLGQASLFRGAKAALLDRFEAALDQPRGSDFHRLEWPKFLDIIEQAAGGIPGWLSSWLASRKPPLQTSTPPRKVNDHSPTPN